METAEKVSPNIPSSPILSILIHLGGKAKPLKAPKKEKKDMDEDEIAFQAKQRAGTSLLKSHKAPGPKLTVLRRCQGEQRNGRESERERPNERWAAGYQEVWEEIECA